MQGNLANQGYSPGQSGFSLGRPEFSGRLLSDLLSRFGQNSRLTKAASTPGQPPSH